MTDFCLNASSGSHLGLATPGQLNLMINNDSPLNWSKLFQLRNLLHNANASFFIFSLQLFSFSILVFFSFRWIFDLKPYISTLATNQPKSDSSPQENDSWEKFPKRVVIFVFYPYQNVYCSHWIHIFKLFPVRSGFFCKNFHEKISMHFHGPSYGQF